MRELRPYQAAGLEALRQTARQGVKRIVLQLPTGGGKTLVSAKIAQSVVAKGGRMAFTVPRIILVDQTIQEFWQEGIRDEVGVLQGNHQLTDLGAPIQVCSIDTLRARKYFPDAKVVIFDEGHILTDAHKEWMAKSPDTIFICLTATPWTKGLGKHFETLLIMETTRGLIEQKYLCPFRVFGPDVPDMRGVKMTNKGDYHEGQSSAVMQKLTGNIVDHWMKFWGKEKTFNFAVDLAHAKAIQERFLQNGISCGYQDAFSPDSDRQQNKKDFHSGKMLVLVSVGTLYLGTDWDVRCIQDCQPTRSEIRHVQKNGRGLRMAPGKEMLIVIDHAGNNWGRTDERGKPTSLGFVTDIHHDHLDMGADTLKSEPKPPLPKACPQCTALRPPRVAKCPNCGFEAQRVNGHHESDGELVEVTPGATKRKPGGGKREYTQAEKIKFYAELKAYAIQHKYKNGWAFHKFSEKFKSRPDRSFEGVAPAPYPSAEVTIWCRSRAIAWAKSKKRQEAHA